MVVGVPDESGKGIRGGGQECACALDLGVTRNGQADLTGRLDDAEIAGQTQTAVLSPRAVFDDGKNHGSP